jgi:hypothetical protein
MKAGAIPPKMGSIEVSTSPESTSLSKTSLSFLQRFSLTESEKPFRRRLMKGSAPSERISSGEAASLKFSSRF